MAINLQSIRMPSTKTIGFSVLQIFLFVWFMTVGIAKLISHPHMVAQFDAVGIGDWFRYFTGALEITGALLLSRSATIAFGSFILTCVCVGAFIARIYAIHGDVMHDIVAAVVLSSITWVHRAQIFDLLSSWRHRSA